MIKCAFLDAGEFEPVYRLPLDVRGGELPVLPLSVRGSVAMGRGTDDANGYMSGEEFFVYKFDPSQAGLAGLSFDEGEFAVFGYVTAGMEDVVAKLGTGDRIVEAKLVSGMDRLINS
jgi:cyclophilin family peptidyl-prolyl cis-trans isomerase